MVRVLDSSNFGKKQEASVHACSVGHVAPGIFDPSRFVHPLPRVHARKFE